MDFFDQPDNVLDEAEALAIAYARGRAGNLVSIPFNGFIAPVLQAQTEPLCQVTVEPQFSRTWVVTLLSYTADRQIGGAPPGVAGVPTDNLTSGISGQAGSGRIDAPFGIFLTLQWGTGQALEQAIIDYPWGGATFQITGAQVRVYGPAMTFGVGVLNLPRLGAFISGANAYGLAQPSRLTYTSTVQNIGATLTATYLAPRRAVGYRIYELQTVAGALQVVDLNQIYLSPAGAVTQLMCDAVAMTPDGISGPPAEEGFFRLHPAATGVQVTNRDATNLRSYGIIWLLDIG